MLLDQLDLLLDKYMIAFLVLCYSINTGIFYIKKFGKEARVMPTKVDLPDQSQSLILTETDQYQIA